MASHGLALQATHDPRMYCTENECVCVKRKKKKRDSKNLNLEKSYTLKIGKIAGETKKETNSDSRDSFDFFRLM